MRFLEATSLNTDNSIYTQQNNDFIIKCLVAQRSEYSKAKTINRCKTILTLSVALISILASIINNDFLSAISGLLAVILLIVNKWTERTISSHKKHAASVQQYIDVTLYSAALDMNKSIWGEIPSQNDLAESIVKYNQADANSMKNWYSDYSSLPAKKQVLYCQKENIRWNSELSKKYKWFNYSVFAVFLLAMVVSFFALNPSFIKAICILTWMSPLAEYCYSLHSEINHSNTLFKKANKKYKHIESQLRNDNIATDDLVILQHQIKVIREEGILIPDWFYKKFQGKQQKNEDQIANTIISQHTESSENNETGNQTTN